MSKSQRKAKITEDRMREAVDYAIAVHTDAAAILFSRVLGMLLERHQVEFCPLLNTIADATAQAFDDKTRATDHASCAR